MSKPSKGYLIPEVDSDDEICVSFRIPNTQEYRMAARGAVMALSRWWNWEKDNQGSAKRVADKFKDILIESLSFGECTMPLIDVRQNTELPCILEKTTDGSNWSQFANLTLCPPRIRTDRGKLQWFNESAGLWQDVNTEDDERTTGSYDAPWPIVPSGQDAKCLSAENIMAVYSTTFTKIRAGLVASDGAVAIASIVTLGLSIFIPQALIATAALALVGEGIKLGESGVADLVDTAAIDNIKCGLFCSMSPDGTLTATAYNEFYASLADMFSGLKLTAVRYYFDCLGVVGLNRQASASGITMADCSGCNCPYDFAGVVTFDAGGYAYTIASGTVAAAFGNPDNALRASGYNAIAQVVIAFPAPIELTKIKLDYLKDSGATNAQIFFSIYNHVPTLVSTPIDTYHTAFNGIWQHYEYTLPSPVADIQYLTVYIGLDGGSGVVGLDNLGFEGIG